MPKTLRAPGIKPGDPTTELRWFNHGDLTCVRRFVQELAQNDKCPDCGRDSYLIFGSGQVYPTHGILGDADIVCPGDVIIIKEPNDK